MVVVKRDTSVAAELALLRMLLHSSADRIAEHRRQLGRQRTQVRKLQRSERDASTALARLAEIEAGLSQWEAERDHLQAELDALV